MALLQSIRSKLLARSAALIVVLAMGTASLFAQTPTATYRGFSIYEQGRASTSDSGQFAVIDTDLGYDITKHVGMDIGVPVYFIRPTLAGQVHQWNNQIGDPYLDVRFTADNHIMNYATIITTSIPARSTGAFSTGHVGIDWFNHFDHPISRFRPFVNAGVANGIINTSQLSMSQPFRLVSLLRTSGLIGEAEGGTDFKVWHSLRVGSSFYALEPSGTQTLAGQPVVNSTITPTAALLTHDRGYSAWVRLLSSRFITTQVGYNHSIKLDQDAATVTIGFDVTRMLGKGPH
ncbi:MAG TPA: hypothetical protein VI685_02465 [Candidatus Angelobacter sp.]